MGLMMHLFASESVALVIGIFYIIWFSGLLGSIIPFPVVVPSPYFELYMVFVQGRQFIDIRDIHYQVVSLGTAKILDIEVGQMMTNMGVLPIAEFLLPIVQLWLSPVLMTGVAVMLLRMVASGGRCPEELLHYPPLRYPIAAAPNNGDDESEQEQEGRTNNNNNNSIPDRTILVTGANGTAGFNLCKDLVERAYSTGNLRLIILCRTDAKCDRVVESLQKIAKESQEKLGIHPTAVQALRDTGAWRNITIEHFGGCNFTDFNAIRKYVARLEDLQNVSKGGLESSAEHNNIRTIQSSMFLNIDTIVNTVGTIARTPKYFPNRITTTTTSRTTTTTTKYTEGNLATNSVGVHLFVTSMMPLLRKTAQRTGVPSRVVITASSCHRHLGLWKCMSPIQMLKALHPPGSSLSDESNNMLSFKAGMSVFGWNYVKVYGLSKLMNVYTTLHLVKECCGMSTAPSSSTKNKKRSEGDAEDAIPSYYSTILPSDKEVFVTMCHPGVFVSTLYTEVVFGFTFLMNVIIRPISYLFFKTGPESAQTLLYLTTALPPSSHPIPSMHVACERQISRIQAAIDQVTSSTHVSREQKELLASHISAFRDITTISFFNSAKSSMDGQQQQNSKNSGSQSTLSASELDAVKTIQTRHRSIQGGYYFDCKEYGITSPVAVCVSKHGQDERMGAECIKWMESQY